MQYDLAGRRPRLSWADGFYVTYAHNLTDALIGIVGNGITPCANYGYDDLGRRASVVRGNGVVTTYAYDPASRLTAMAHDLAGTAADQVYGYAYNPAGQIIGLSAANDTYGYGALASGTDVYGIDGLNRITAVNGGALAYDANANLTSDGTRAFAYDAANRLRGTGSSTLDYDALGRLRQMVGTQGAQYIYDGAEIAGIGTSGTTVGNKLVRGPWPDELVVSFAGTAPTYSVQDHLSSTVALTDASGTATFINRYDDYGRPQAGNGSRFQYTGQMWLPDFGVYHYKARQYHPGLGRFLQTDPIGYAAGANLYAYVGNDPVNSRDPSGLLCGFDLVGRFTDYVNSETGEVVRTELNGISLRPNGQYCAGEAPFSFAGSFGDSLGGGGTNPGNLPQCIVNAVTPLLGYRPDQVRLRRGSPFSFFRGSSVTFGNNIFLHSPIYDTMLTSPSSTWVVFHEVGHTQQYAEGRLSVIGAVIGYARVGFRHEDAWFEIEANRFADAAEFNFNAAGGYSSCG